MRRRLLRFIGTRTFRFAWLAFPLLAIVTYFAVRSLEKIEIDHGLAPFLPVSQASEIRDIFGDIRNLEPVMVVITSNEPGRETELKTMAREMARQLDQSEFFDSAVCRVDEQTRSYYESLADANIVKLMTADDWNNLERLMTAGISAEKLKTIQAYRINAFTPRALQSGVAASSIADPLGAFDSLRERMASSRGPTNLPTRDGYFISQDGRSIAILGHAIYSPENARQTVRISRYLNRCREHMRRVFPAVGDQFKIEFAGSHVNAAENINNAQDSLGRILYLSLFLAALLVILVFRKVESIFFIFFPAAVGFVWTLGLASSLFDSVSVISIGLLFVLLVVGLLYSVHLYHRFTFELYQSGNYYRALTRSYVETGRGILTSASVMAVIFLLSFLATLRGQGSGIDWHNILTQPPGFSQLGLVLGLGILCNLASCLLVIPVFAAFKWLLARGRVKPVDLYQFGLERIYQPAIDNPRAALLVMVLICFYFGFHARGLDFSMQFASLRSTLFLTEKGDSVVQVTFSGAPGAPAELQELGARIEKAIKSIDGVRQVTTMPGESIGNVIALIEPARDQKVAELIDRAMAELKPAPPEKISATLLPPNSAARADWLEQVRVTGFPRPGRPIVAIVRGGTHEQALEQNDRLYENLRGLDPQNYNILSYDSLRAVLPSARSQQASLARLEQLDLEPFQKTIQKVSKAVGFKPSIYQPFIESLRQFKTEARATPYINYFDNENLIATVQRYMTRKNEFYYIATPIYPQATGFNPSQLDNLAAQLSMGITDLKLVGDSLTERQLEHSIRYNLALMLFLAFFVILICLLLHFHGRRLAWIAFVPIICEIVWICGAMVLADIQLHFFTLLVLPLVVCLTLDNTVQLTQYYQDRRPASVQHAMESIGRVAMLTCGLSALLLGTMVLVDFPELRDLGGVALLGGFMTLIGTTILLPALLQLFGEGQPLGAALDLGNETSPWKGN